jgi:hypothetical protein
MGKSLRVLMESDNERRSRGWLPVRTGSGARRLELLQPLWFVMMGRLPWT